MRVLMLAACPLPWPRGTPIRIHHLAEALASLGHQVEVVAYPAGDASVPVNYRLHRVGGPGTAMETAPGPSLRKLAHLDPLLYTRARRMLAAGPFDVIHAHHYEGLVAGLLARRTRPQVPLVFDCHTLLGPELPQYPLPVPRRWRAAIGGRLDRWLPRRADHLIAVSEGMRQWLAAAGGVPAERISLIPNGVEHAHFGVSAPAATREAGRPRIVFAGNLAEYQNVRLLLQAFRRVLDAVPDAALALVTDDGIEPVRPTIDALGLTGAVLALDGGYAELPARLAEADVLANPRVQCSGVPQKVLNYMAAGRGIVSFESSRGPLRHGMTALVVPDGDVAAFAAALVRLLREPALAGALGRAARAEVVSERGWDQVAARVTALYHELVNP
jgi:glycosyltransferase involved in cell wall biosynthesis